MRLQLDGEKVYYIYNGHGDVTALLSSSGSVIASYYYDAFGVILEESGNFGNPYRYAGYMYDEASGLYDLKSRFFDAKLARFLSEDTFAGDRADPLSLNRYSYCVNNPLIYWDPTGHAKVNTVDYATSNGGTVEYYTNKDGKDCVRVTYNGVSQGYIINSGKIEDSKLNDKFGWGATSNIAVRAANASQGNTVTWNNNRTITITPNGGGKSQTLIEGEHFRIVDGTAYYIDQKSNQVTNYQPNAVWHEDRTITYNDSSGHEKRLIEGIDFYCGSDGKAYLYNNVVTMMEVKGYTLDYDQLKGLKEGVHYYIGEDGKAHFTNSDAPPPMGPKLNGNYPAYGDLTAAEREAYNNEIYKDKPAELWPLGGDTWTNWENWPNYNELNGGGPHGGNDIAAPEGTEISSVYYGIAYTVTSVEKDENGNVIYDKDGNVTYTGGGKYVKVVSTINGKTETIYYMHMSDFAIKDGTEVAPGTVIGYVGSTGNSTGNHLHFQVNSNGKPGDDPYEFLPQEPNR